MLDFRRYKTADLTRHGVSLRPTFPRTALVAVDEKCAVHLPKVPPRDEPWQQVEWLFYSSTTSAQHQTFSGCRSLANLLLCLYKIAMLGVLFSKDPQLSVLYGLAHGMWSACKKGQGIPISSSTSNKNINKGLSLLENASCYPSRQCFICCSTWKRSETPTDGYSLLWSDFIRFQSSVVWIIVTIYSIAQLR